MDDPKLFGLLCRITHDSSGLRELYLQADPRGNRTATITIAYETTGFSKPAKT